MTRANILILHPDEGDPAFQGRWREIFKELRRCIERFGMKVDASSWRHLCVEEPRDADIVLPLLAWGYHRDYAFWLSQCANWQVSSLRMLNAPDILRWNSDKRYLQYLHERGVPVVPSLYREKICPAVLLESLEAFGVDALVVKPTVSATAWKTSVWTKDVDLEDAPEGPCIIQPFMESIRTQGEISLIFIDAEFSHGLRKTPRTGDFRVQPEYGGHLSSYLPDRAALAAADSILSSLPGPLLYARIDMVRDALGNWVLLEAELIEPDLFLGFDEGCGNMFANALLRHVSSTHASV